MGGGGSSKRSIGRRCIRLARTRRVTHNRSYAPDDPYGDGGRKREPMPVAGDAEWSCRIHGGMGAPKCNTHDGYSLSGRPGQTGRSLRPHVQILGREKHRDHRGHRGGSRRGSFHLPEPKPSSARGSCSVRCPHSHATSSSTNQNGSVLMEDKSQRGRNLMETPHRLLRQGLGQLGGLGGFSV